MSGGSCRKSTFRSDYSIRFSGIRFLTLFSCLSEFVHYAAVDAISFPVFNCADIQLLDSMLFVQSYLRERPLHARAVHDDRRSRSEFRKDTLALSVNGLQLFDSDLLYA